jgi:hypothetical protein
MRELLQLWPYHITRRNRHGNKVWWTISGWSHEYGQRVTFADQQTASLTAKHIGGEWERA